MGHRFVRVGNRSSFASWDDFNFCLRASKTSRSASAPPVRSQYWIRAMAGTSPRAGHAADSERRFVPSDHQPARR